MEFSVTGLEKWSVIQIVQFLFQNYNYLVHDYNYLFTFLLAVCCNIHTQWEFTKNFEHIQYIKNFNMLDVSARFFFFFFWN